MNQIRLIEDALHIYAADVIRTFGRPGVVAYHIPNQGMHKVQYRVKLKQMGLCPGAGDFGFVLPPDGHSAFLEIKTLTGRQSDDQILFEGRVSTAGAKYLLARTPEGIDAALTALGVIDKPVSQPAKR